MVILRVISVMTGLAQNAAAVGTVCQDVEYVYSDNVFGVYCGSGTFTVMLSFLFMAIILEIVYFQYNAGPVDNDPINDVSEMILALSAVHMTLLTVSR